MTQNPAMGQETILAGKGGELKTSNSAWGTTILGLSLPIGFSIPLDDRGTASAEGRAKSNADGGATGTHRQAHVKGTCRLAVLCGQCGLPVKPQTRKGYGLPSQNKRVLYVRSVTTQNYKAPLVSCEKGTLAGCRE